MHILILSDSPTVASGYGGQVMRIGRRLSKSGHKVSYFGGGVRGPLQRYEFQGSFVYTHPAYGDVPSLRHLLNTLKNEGNSPDLLFVFVDVRFVEYLLTMESEIRRHCPIVLWHLWDNVPYPWFNEPFYDMCTRVICGSKFTYDLLKPKLGDKARYVSLGVDTKEFRPVFDPKERKLLTGAEIPPSVRMIVGWAHRNILRKRLPDVMTAYERFSKGKEKEVALLMHTSPRDPEGSDIIKLRPHLVSKDRMFFLSPAHGHPPEVLNLLYDKMDVHLNIAWNEGFGLTVLESMAAGVPNVVVNTAEMSNIVGDTGWVLEPDVSYQVANRTYPPIGTQLLLNIDIVSVDKVVETLNYMFENMGEVHAKKEEARQRAVSCFSIEDTVRKMEEELVAAVEAAEPLSAYTCVEV